MGLYSHAGLIELDGYERGLGLAGFEEGQLVAASVSQLLAPEDLAYYDVFGVGARRRLNGHAVLSFEALAVEPAHRRRGLGSELTLASRDWGARRGADLVVTISWLGERSGHSWPMFEALGFEAVADSSEVYTADSLQNGWLCPICGNPCRCSGRLYVRPLASPPG